MNKKIHTSYTKGLWAETLSAALLRLKGYHIIKQRYKSHFGEIDLIARKGRTLHFIEVKARYSFDEARCCLTYHQQQRIGRSAMQWISFNPQFYDFDIAFDMVLVVPKRLPRHIKHAFTYKH